eukprot:TRINITY_DN65970_c0_g1_i1.p1 TRINITY_DN65970_c0_g1~~TRINITY_DN65970_c0_g1_i1.p1  ORF type:complete len:983 (+),score=199.28 TRINITY_DN65970_c0_g1_i1:309-2951(+)
MFGGGCPPVSPDVFGICVEQCSADEECNDGQRCCSNGCGHTCQNPIPVDPDMPFDEAQIWAQAEAFGFPKEEVIYMILEGGMSVEQIISQLKLFGGLPGMPGLPFPLPFPRPQPQDKLLLALQEVDPAITSGQLTTAIAEARLNRALVQKMLQNVLSDLADGTSLADALAAVQELLEPRREAIIETVLAKLKELGYDMDEDDIREWVSPFGIDVDSFVNDVLSGSMDMQSLLANLEMFLQFGNPPNPVEEVEEQPPADEEPPVVDPSSGKQRLSKDEIMEMLKERFPGLNDGLMQLILAMLPDDFDGDFDKINDLVPGLLPRSKLTVMQDTDEQDENKQKLFELVLAIVEREFPDGNVAVDDVWEILQQYMEMDLDQFLNNEDALEGLAKRVIIQLENMNGNNGNTQPEEDEKTKAMKEEILEKLAAMIQNEIEASPEEIRQALAPFIRLPLDELQGLINGDRIETVIKRVISSIFQARGISNPTDPDEGPNENGDGRSATSLERLEALARQRIREAEMMMQQAREESARARRIIAGADTDNCFWATLRTQFSEEEVVYGLKMLAGMQRERETSPGPNNNNNNNAGEDGTQDNAIGGGAAGEEANDADAPPGAASDAASLQAVAEKKMLTAKYPFEEKTMAEMSKCEREVAQENLDKWWCTLGAEGKFRQIGTDMETAEQMMGKEAARAMQQLNNVLKGALGKKFYQSPDFNINSILAVVQGTSLAEMVNGMMQCDSIVPPAPTRRVAATVQFEVANCDSFMETKAATDGATNAFMKVVNGLLSGAEMTFECTVDKKERSIVEVMLSFGNVPADMPMGAEQMKDMLSKVRKDSFFGGTRLKLADYLDTGAACSDITDRLQCKATGGCKWKKEKCKAKDQN